MKIRLIESKWDSIQCDALLIPAFEDDDLSSGVAGEIDQRLSGLLSELRQKEEWSGKTGELTIIYRPADIPVSRLILVGAGPRDSYDSAAIRQLVMNAIHKVKAYGLQTIAVWRRSDVAPAMAAQAAVEGVVLGVFDVDEFKTQGRAKTRVEEILFATDRPLPKEEVDTALAKGEILAQAANLARSLVNQPGNQLNPTGLAEKAREIADRYGLQIDVFGESEIEEMEMEAVLAVGRGSDEPARLIVLRHFGTDPSAPPIVLIGKGVTFDAGGLSLKTPTSMEDMKTDKAGGCAVLGAMQAIAQLQLAANVVGIIPAVENLPSGRAQRPGDVIRSMSGKTIEVLNTDAEGRLLLADAIHYALQLKPRCIIDIATLTGASVVALGKKRAALFSNHDQLRDRVLKASEISGEKLWTMPLGKEYRKALESDIADLKNVGGRYGAASIAAAFLQEFAGDAPWAHLDIAGVDTFTDDDPVKGPTGFGVRTLVELVWLTVKNEIIQSE